MINAILKPYGDADLVVQTRARNLFWVLVAFLAVVLIVGVMTLFTSEPWIAVISLVLFAGMAAALDRLRRGQYALAANLAFVFFLVTAAAAALATRTGSLEDDVIRTMALFSLGLSLTSFFGSSWVQGLIMAVAGAVVMGITLVVPVPADQLAMTIATVNQKANPVAFLVLFALSGVVSALSLAQTGRILSQTQKAQAVTEEGFQNITRAFEETRSGLTISQRLGEVGTSLAEGTQSIELAVAVLAVQSDNLQDQTRQASESSQDLDRIQTNLRALMSDQSKAVLITSAALEEITANIQSITASARTKKEALDQIKGQAQAGEIRLRELEGAILQMQRTAEDILSVVQVIEDISDRTNLLAMNASIEAAHAGNTGRGFAVVSSEIRKLAEETSQNSKQIRETLDRNLEQVGTAVKASAASQALLKTTIQAFYEIQTLLAEQLEGMEELALGTNQILGTVDNLRQGTDTVQGAAEEVRTTVEKNRLHSESIQNSVEALRHGVSTLESVSRSIAQGIGTLQEVGVDNLQYGNKLNRTLETIRATMEEKKESLR